MEIKLARRTAPAAQSLATLILLLFSLEMRSHSDSKLEFSNSRPITTATQRQKIAAQIKLGRINKEKNSSAVDRSVCVRKLFSFLTA